MEKCEFRPTKMVMIVSVLLSGAGGRALAGQVETNKPDVIKYLESFTNGPCVNVTSEEPYGFPMTIECPFVVKKELLDQAVEQARKACPAKIIKATVGNFRHPGWSPGVSFVYEPFRTHVYSVTPYYGVSFSDRTEKREPGKARCGMDLVTISAAVLHGGINYRTNDVFVVGDMDVVASVHCERLVRPASSTNGACIAHEPCNAKARVAIQSLLQSLEAGKYLLFAAPGKLKTIAGLVYPGDEEKALIPAAMAGTAFKAIDANDEFTLQLFDSMMRDEMAVSINTVDVLKRGRNLDLALFQGMGITYDLDTGWITIQRFNGKFSSKLTPFSQVDGIWIMGVGHSCRY